MPSVIAKEVYSSSPFNFGAPREVVLDTEEVVNEPLETLEEPTPIPSSSPKSQEKQDKQDGYGYADSDVDEDYQDDDEFQDPDEGGQEEPQRQEIEINEEEAVASLREAFISLGFVNDDKEIDNPASVADFLVKYEKLKATKIEEALKDDYKKTYSEEKIKYVDFLMNGGSPEAISSYYTIANLPIEDEHADRENIKALVLAMHKDRGLNDKKALTLYNTAYDEGDDLNEAKEAKAYFRKKHDAQLKVIEDQKEAERQEIVRQNDENAARLKGLLKSRNIEGIQITEDEAKDLESYMFSKNVITDVDDPETGLTYKGKVSQYYLEYQNFMQQPDALIKLARFIKNNGKVEDQKERMKEEVNRELIVKLNGFNSKSRQNQPRKRNAFLT
jgi:hypothetical protein